MAEIPIPLVVLCGSPYERGVQHGRRFAAEIRKGVRHRVNGLSPDRLRRVYERAKLAVESIGSIAPDTAAELRGIADGSGRDTLDIVLRSSFELFGIPNETGCSALAVRTSRGIVVAQNWDAPVGSEAEQALFLHVFQGDFQFATVASFGGLGWVGCNRSGLAMVNNDLVLVSNSDGVPSQIARRIFLTAKDVNAAVGAANSLPHMAGRAYIFGDADNRLATVEVSARHGVYVSRTGTFVAHTNHALNEEIRKDEDVALLAKQYPSSEERLEVLISRAASCASTEDVMEVLRNRQGTPDAVCKATSPREPTQTAFSIVMQCWNRTLFIARGMPSMADYEQISF